MLKKIALHLTKPAIIALEICAIGLLVVSIALGVLVWRMSSGPVDVGFAKNYIQSALSNEKQGFSVSMDDVILEWPNFTGRFLLNLRGVNIHVDKGRKASLSIDEVDVALSRRYLLIGLIRPVSVILDQPSLQLVRKKDEIDVFLQDQKIDQDKQGEPKDPRFEVARFFRQIADAEYKKGGPLTALKTFEINNAKVVVNDYELGVSWYLTNLDFSLKERMEGVVASISLPLNGDTVESGGLTMDLIYRDKEKDFTFTAESRGVNPGIFSRFLPESSVLAGHDLVMNGKIEAGLDKDLNLKMAKVGIDIPQGILNIPQEYNDPLVIKDVSLDALYVNDMHSLEINSLKATVGDASFSISSNAVVGPEEISIPMIIQAPELSLEAAQSLFPKSESDGEAARWIVGKLSEGSFSEVVGEVTIGGKKEKDEEGEENWAFEIASYKLGFAFDNMKVQYSDTLMPITEAKGKGLLENDNLTIEGESAKIKDVTGSNAVVEVTDLTVPGGGYAKIKLDTSGPLSTTLAYASDEPIEVGDKLGFDTKDVKGNIDLHVELGFPTLEDLPKEEVDVKLTGTMTNVTIPNIVKGLTLTGGPLEIRSEEGAFFVNGSGKLADRDVKLDWTQYFDPAGKPFEAQIKAQIAADEELRHHFGVDLDEWISGTMPVDVTYTDRGDYTSVVEVKGNLNPVRVHITPFKYEKPPGVDGNVTAKALLKKDVLQEIDDIQIKTQNFSLQDARLIFSPLKGEEVELKRGSVATAMMDRSVMKVDFEITDTNVLKVTANGSVFDATAFTTPDENAKEKPKEETMPMMVSLTADKVFMKKEEDRFLKKTKLYMETDADGDMTRMEVDSKAGTGEVFVRFRPNKDGRRIFRMEAVDAGEFLYAMGLYDNVRGGTIAVYGAPKTGDLYGDLEGVARLENFRVVKAPALAKLLSIMSLTGVTQILNQEGLAFTKLESDFEWRFRSGGNLLVVKDGRTSGSSIGLTFEGTVDQKTQMTDIRGTIIPMTEVNDLLSNIPLIGDILTGGSGLIAATYTMKGPSHAPEVSVNPLSVLTPGFLRTILFEGGFDSSIPDDE